MNEHDPVDPKLSMLERAVLDVALAADTELNSRLRDQADAAVVATRTPSGVGFMTKLIVPDALTIPDRPADETLPAVQGAHRRSFARMAFFHWIGGKTTQTVREAVLILSAPTAVRHELHQHTISTLRVRRWRN